MPHDEALGLAQILLTLLVFALGIPALIIETSSEERVRHLLHRRMRGGPTALMLVALAVVMLLILVTGSERKASWLNFAGKPDEAAAKVASIAIVGIFAIVWVRLMARDVRLRLIQSIGRRMHKSLRKEEAVLSDDLEDLVSLGENLMGDDQAAVIEVIGTLCRAVQERRGYEGTELEHLIEGLRRVIQGERYPADERNYRRALTILTDCWARLVQGKFTHDRDAGVIKEAASALGESAVAKGSEKIALRCMVAILNVVEVPYRVGMAGLRHRRMTIANEGLSRLESIASEKRKLSWQLIALVSYMCLEGGSMAAHARRFGKRLGFSDSKVLSVARLAADHLESIGAFTVADTIRVVWRPSPVRVALRNLTAGVLG